MEWDRAGRRAALLGVKTLRVGEWKDERRVSITQKTSPLGTHPKSGSLAGVECDLHSRL